jgi:hypothetical protein
VADGLNPAIVGLKKAEPPTAWNPRDRAIRAGNAHGCRRLIVPWLIIVACSIPKGNRGSFGFAQDDRFCWS